MGVRNLWSYNFARIGKLSDVEPWRLSDLEHNHLLCGRERAILSELTHNIEWPSQPGKRDIIGIERYRTFHENVIGPFLIGR